MDIQKGFSPIIIILIIITIFIGGILTWQYLVTSEKETIQKPNKVIKKEISEDPYNCLKNKAKITYAKNPIPKKILDDKSLKEVILRSIIKEFEKADYSKKELCSAQSIIINVQENDLNKDNIPEYIAFPDCIELSRGPSCIGGTGGTPILIFGFIKEKWESIGNLWGFWRGPLKNYQTEGYPNLVTYMRTGANSGIYNEYSWTGERYEQTKTIESNDGFIPDEYLELYKGKG